MTLFRYLFVSLALLGLLAAADGCRRNARPAEPVAPPPKTTAQTRPDPNLQKEVHQAFVAVEDFLAQGKINIAILSIENLFDDPRFVSQRPRLFDGLLLLLFRCGDEKGACQRARAACADPALAESACSLPYRHFRDSGDLRNASAWASELAFLPSLRPDLRKAAIQWFIEDSVALRRDDEALAMLERSLGSIEPRDRAGLASQAIDALLAAGRVAGAERAIRLAEQIKPRPPEFAELVMSARARIFAARGDWAALIPDFTNAVQTLSDGELDRLIRALFPAVEKTDKRALVRQWAELVVTRGQSRSNLTSSVSTAARFWAEGVLATDKGGLPACLDVLLRAQVQANTVADLFRRHYYEFTENAVALKQLTALGERLALRVDSGELRDDVRGKVLDGCFLLRDYDRALSLLEAGMTGRDPQWHATAIVKVKAHRALERNEPREAVKYFRDFMRCLRDSKDASVPDPVTHLVFPKEMVLGRNAKRIGDILAGIPDRAEAAKAYAEARALYTQALKDTPEPDARKVIEAEIAQLPKDQ